MFVKRNMFSNFAMCQIFLDLSDQILRPDTSSVNVQGLNAPCESSKIQIMRNNSQIIRFLSAGNCYATKQKLS